MKGKWKEPDQIQLDCKKDSYILLPFFLSGFFNQANLQDRDILIIEEVNDLIGCH